MRRLCLLALTLICLATLAGCVPGDGTSTPEDPDGLIWGVWHGWIAPISLIWGLFNEAIRVYEPVNTGWWYDLGFYAGLLGGFGGLALTRKRSKDD